MGYDLISFDLDGTLAAASTGRMGDIR